MYQCPRPGGIMPQLAEIERENLWSAAVRRAKNPASRARGHRKPAGPNNTKWRGASGGPQAMVSSAARTFPFVSGLRRKTTLPGLLVSQARGVGVRLKSY